MRTKNGKDLAFDSFALISYLADEAGADKIEALLEAAQKKEINIFVNEINIGEVFYILWKKRGENAAREALNLCFGLPLNFISPNRNFILAAAELKAKYKISYADAFCLETARRENCSVITGDPEFIKIPGIKIIWLSR